MVVTGESQSGPVAYSPVRCSWARGPHQSPCSRVVTPAPGRAPRRRRLGKRGLRAGPVSQRCSGHGDGNPRRLTPRGCGARAAKIDCLCLTRVSRSALRGPPVTGPGDVGPRPTADSGSSGIRIAPARPLAYVLLVSRRVVRDLPNSRHEADGEPSDDANAREQDPADNRAPSGANPTTSTRCSQRPTDHA